MLRRQKFCDPKQLPPGTFIKTEKGYFYVYSSTLRYPFSTPRVMQSWRPHRVVNVSETNECVKRLKILGLMKFRDGSLLINQADGRLYLVSAKKIRHITNPDVLTGLGIDRYEAMWVSQAEINLHEIGEPLN